MDDLIAEVRRTNQLLLLAFGSEIGNRLDILRRSPAMRTVIETLESGDEATTDAVLAAAKRVGVARTQVFEAIADLQRAGVVDRPRRGVVALSRAAAPLLSGKGRSGDG